ncbi:MAG: pyridoxal-phosphate dependent enzyme [Cyclobacteriaceae bacterium]|jgi:threonine dehydratase|nr:pyridoxal-phosphate dependent enzyme [Cyclobacteriaceae bacterium]
MTLVSVPTAADIVATHERIRPFIHRTPILTSAGLDAMAGCQLFFKCENFQKVGAFKARGAMNGVLSLREADRQKGVATHSSGNHAQAIARAAQMAGIPAYIVMPNNAPQIKKKGVLGYGGQIFECENTLAARETTLARVVAQTGAYEIHPFNNYDVIAGQATAAKEVYEDLGPIDIMMAPVGGGGLLSGTVLATRYFSPGTTVIAAEPDLANDAYRSLQSGRIEAPLPPTSVADGLLTSLGDKTFPIIREGVPEIITVSEAEIIQALRLIWERLKVVIEPSCSVPFAAVLKKPDVFRGQRVAMILTGGNVDLDRLAKLFS